MKQVITLDYYLKIGGKLEKINWQDAFCDYGDKNSKSQILSYCDKGETNGHGLQLFHFTFSNGNVHRYAISWIKLKVEFVLSDIYK